MASGNVKKFELKLGRAGIIIVVTGMAALLCGSFLFGVHMGRDLDTHPEKISSLPGKALALVWKPARAKAVNAPAARKETAPAEDPESIDLTFYNTLTGKKGQTDQAQTTEEKAPERSYAEITAMAPAPPDESKSAEKPKPSALAADIKPQAPSTPKATAPESVPSEKTEYVVHVASLKDREKALQVHKTVATMGYPSARVIRANVPGKGIWYRIMVPGFPSKEKAQAAADRISPAVKAKCIVKLAQTG